MTDEPSRSVVRLAVYVDPALDKQLRLACLEHEPRLTLSEAVEAAVRLWLDTDPDELDGRVKENC